MLMYFPNIAEREYFTFLRKIHLKNILSALFPSQIIRAFFSAEAVAVFKYLFISPRMQLSLKIFKEALSINNPTSQRMLII